MIENIIGKRYANALSAGLEDHSQLRQALQGIESIGEAFKTEPRLARFFSHPGIPDENKMGMVNELCDKLSAGVEIRKLLTLLVERRKILFLPNIVEHFEAVVDKRLEQVRAAVVSAHPLSEQNIERLKSSLKRITGKEVLIETTLDESLIAGVVIRVGSLVADATVKNRLAALKHYIEKEEVA